MSDKIGTFQWTVIGSSVRGASHLRSDMPNQDAIHYIPETGSGSVVAMAVADGHGSAKSFRSDVGARIAVQVCIQVLNESWENIVRNGHPNLTAIKRDGEDRLPKLISRLWRQRVDEHCAANPFSADELRKMKNDKAVTEYINENKVNYQAYGATLLSALITETFMLCLQLGDGDILLVSPDFSVSRAVPKDPALIANETTSLCMPSPEREFRVVFLNLASSRPALVMMSTDGYSNSFSNDEGYLKAASDILAIAHEEGIESIRKQAPAWLEDASKKGSGDDITLGLIMGDVKNVSRPVAIPETMAEKGEPAPVNKDDSKQGSAPAAESKVPAVSLNVTEDNEKASNSLAAAFSAQTIPISVPKSENPEPAVESSPTRSELDPPAKAEDHKDIKPSPPK